MRKNRILIIDDEDDINFLFKMVLEDTFNDPLIAFQNFTAAFRWDFYLSQEYISRFRAEKRILQKCIKPAGAS